MKNEKKTKTEIFAENLYNVLVSEPEFAYLSADEAGERVRKAFDVYCNEETGQEKLEKLRDAIFGIVYETKRQGFCQGIQFARMEFQ